MRGQWDGIASMEDLLKFFAKLPNPDKQFTVMPGISHASFQQKNYMLVYHILPSFFAQPGRCIAGLRSARRARRLIRPSIAPNPSPPTSTGTVGAASPVFGPYSFDAARCAPVRRPHVAAAARSLRCAATIMHCAGAQIERLAGGEIDARLRLVVAGDFGAEDRVPRQIVAAREIDHQRDVAVRARRQHEFRLEPRQRRRHVRPGVEPVPGQIEFVAAPRRTDRCKPKRGRKRSRLRRCSTSSLQNGMRPERTSSMPGWYSPRQASAKAIQSRL